MKKILLPLMALLVFASCQKETATEKVTQEMATVSSITNAGKIKICHTDQPTGKSKVISIDSKAWPSHQAHGDVRLDDQDRDGYVPNNACGFGQMGDCNDNPALGGTAINPGATEICGNGIDENCNGQIDENCIASVTICNQVWMVKNLDVTKYRNGDDIPQVTDATAWATLTTGAWCYYDNNTANGTTYGKLYNWYAVNDLRGLAPLGWHIPTDAEWTTLITCLGGEAFAGGPMKEAGTSHWWSPNTSATNSSGFTGLPGGFRYYDGTFYNVGNAGGWYSSTEDEYGATYAWFRSLGYFSASAGSGTVGNTYGVSVRCVRD